MSKTPTPEDIECFHCGKIGGVHYVSRATWICEHCKSDNSVYYVMLCEAIDKEENPDE